MNRESLNENNLHKFGNKGDRFRLSWWGWDILGYGDVGWDRFVYGDSGWEKNCLRHVEEDERKRQRQREWKRRIRAYEEVRKEWEKEKKENDKRKLKTSHPLIVFLVFRFQFLVFGF